VFHAGNKARLHKLQDKDCVSFLQWALPQMRMRWQGFRKVRRQVCKRIDRRLMELGLAGISGYRSYMETHPEEWQRLDDLCRISISRFYRDREVFDYLASNVFPILAEQAISRGETEIRSWSIGCAGGEEAYSLMILWRVLLESRFPGLSLYILATDSDPGQLARAREARYEASALKEMPDEWQQSAFYRVNGRHCLREQFRIGVTFEQQDIRRDLADSSFHLILCRNLVFTYYEEELQRDITTALGKRLLPNGLLVLGKHERLPQGVRGFSQLAAHLPVFAAASNASPFHKEYLR
jgi:chemotaxis protein methyltransferase CheR